MQAYANYKINIGGTQEDTAAATNILAEAFDDKTLRGRTTINIEGTRKVVWFEQAIIIAKRIAREVPALQKMEINGSTDSESDGTMMDFLIKFEGGLLTAQSTEWYGIFEAFGIDYEEFCEEYCDENENPLYSEEEFEKFISGEEPYFVVEDEYGDPIIVETVKLGDPQDIDPNSEDSVMLYSENADWDEDDANDDWDDED